MLRTTNTTSATALALIRGATGADLPAVERLLTSSELPIDGVREAIGTFIVAESGGALVGVAGIELCGEHALLRSVAVTPEWRSKGLGRELVTRVIADAESRGIHALYLLTTTAERYFPSFGFEQIARNEVPASVQATREFQGACPASATVMRRALARKQTPST
jgi:amino-acid N-acetyltransferase